MNNNSFDRDYINSVDSAAPDMDKLWERIAGSEADGGDITPFLAAAEECGKPNTVRSANIFRIFASAAAVFAAVFCISLVFPANKANDMAGSENTVNELAFPDAETEAMFAADVNTVKAVSGWDYSEEVSGSLSYAGLELAYTESPAYSGEPFPDTDREYFVEDDVLAQTDYFLDCRIVSSHNTVTPSFTVEVIHLIGGETAEVPEEMQVYSRSPYNLKTGREYLLPIKLTSEGDPYVTFDSAPQIEFSENRELICHNGWQTLAKNGNYIEYPQTCPDDYFYDRMNIAAEVSLDALFDKWRELHA